jgi:hypothetical protein
MRNDVQACLCAQCRGPDGQATRELHAELNRFLGSLDEDKRLLFLGLESMNPTYGGDLALERITGINSMLIAKTRWRLQESRLRQRTLYEGYGYGHYPVRKQPWSCLLMKQL